MKNLKNKRVFITGAGRGIGFAIAKAFAFEGANLIIADIDEKTANEAAGRIEAMGVSCTAYKMDVSRYESIEAVFGKVKKDFGKIDVLVNNAGVQIRQPSVEFTEDNWDKLMDINLKGAFFSSQQALKLMDQAGVIVNISSGTSTQTIPGRAPYVISKAGVNAMTAVLAAEWAKAGVRVNAVAPGWIKTEMLQDGLRLGIVSERQIFAAVPAKRLAETSEIADAVIYLASDEASYVTGQTLFVDGGWNGLGLPDIEL